MSASGRGFIRYLHHSPVFAAQVAASVPAADDIVRPVRSSPVDADCAAWLKETRGAIDGGLSVARTAP